MYPNHSNLLKEQTTKTQTPHTDAVPFAVLYGYVHGYLLARLAALLARYCRGV